MTSSLQPNTYTVAGEEFTLTQGQSPDDSDHYIGSLRPAVFLSLPIPLVSASMEAMKKFPEQAAKIAHSLTIRELAPMLWRCKAVEAVLVAQSDIENIVIVGARFGQQSAIMSRSAANYAECNVRLIEPDEGARAVAAFLLSKDPYHGRQEVAFDSVLDLDRVYPSHTLFLWENLEQFESTDVEVFLENNPMSSFIFTARDPASSTCVFPVTDFEDIETVLPIGWENGVVYRGDLQSSQETTFMFIVHGPGVQLDEKDEEGDENDGLDGPNR